eukprot:6491321-Amphidinium_carterae.1
MAMNVWLGTLSDRERYYREEPNGEITRTRTVNVNEGSVRELLPHDLQAECSRDADAVHGLVVLSKTLQKYRGDMELQNTERSQLHFWRSFFGVGLDIAFIVFTVLEVQPLHSQPLQMRPP